jgi:succinate dehydrogenase / fumarate reductase flavoprotein subunit
MYRHVGVERSAAGLRTAIEEIRNLRARFWREVRVPGTGAQLNQALERAGRVADFLELAELMAVDALDREESCGAHFRTEFQDDGEARRDDANWAFASAWGAREDRGRLEFTRHVEPLSFTAVPLATRSYR